MTAAAALVPEIGVWAKIVLGLVVLVTAVGRITAGRESPGRVARNLRATFLVGLALCIGATALVVVGGLSDGVFHDEDVVLLTVCWTVLALIWLAGRYVPVFMRRRAGDA